MNQLVVCVVCSQSVKYQQTAMQLTSFATHSCDLLLMFLSKRVVMSFINGFPSQLQAKKLVESLPQEIRANVFKDEAEKLKAALEAAGGTVALE